MKSASNRPKYLLQDLHNTLKDDQSRLDNGHNFISWWSVRKIATET